MNRPYEGIEPLSKQKTQEEKETKLGIHDIPTLNFHKIPQKEIRIESPSPVDKIDAKTPPIQTFNFSSQLIAIPPPQPRDSIASLLVNFVDISQNIQMINVQDAQKRIQSMTEKLAYFHDQEVQKLAEVAKLIAQRDTWDFLRKIATGLVGVATMILGGSCIASATPIGIGAGSCLVVSGGASILALILQETCDAPAAVAALSISAAALGLAGGGLGMYAGLFTGTLETLLTVGSCALQLTMGISSFAQGWTDYETNHLRAELKKIEAHVYEEESRLEDKGEEIQYLTKLDTITEAVRSLMDHHQGVIQQIIYQTV